MSGSQSYCHQPLHTDISQSNQKKVTSARDFVEAHLSGLKCSVCTEYMIPPITQCCNGHNICKKCRLNIECCPLCKGQLSGICNHTLERTAWRQMYPCINRDKGCSQVLSRDLIADHQAVCRYGPMKCPMNKFPSVKCSWKGLMTELKKHVTESHEDYCNEAAYIMFHTMGNGAVRFKVDEMFLIYTKIIARQYFCVVQLVGTKEEAANYKSQLTFIGDNGVDEIVETFVVRSFTEDFSDSFQSAKCFVIDEKVFCNLSKNERFNGSLKILKIEK